MSRALRITTLVTGVRCGMSPCHEAGPFSIPGDYIGIRALVVCTGTARFRDPGRGLSSSLNP